MSVDLATRASRYGAFFETIQADHLDGFGDLVTETIRFKDPFNDVRGVDRVVKLLAKMFDDADDIRFRMREQAGDGNVFFLRWHFTCRPKSRFLSSEWQVDGISVVTLTEAGLVAEHVDYWDAAEQLYGRLPLVGPFLRLVSRPLTMRD